MAAILVITLIPVNTLAAGTWTNPFTDVKSGNWFYDAVKYMNYNGYISGTSKTTFSPNTTTSRAMFVTILGRIVGIDENEYKGKSTFDDVKSGWAEPYIAWAAQNKVVSGVGNNKFNPDGVVTREQSATILYNYLVSAGYDLTIDDNALSKFDDVGSISGYAKAPMTWIVTAGIVQGDGSGKIKPKADAPRSQIAQIFMKYIDYKSVIDTGEKVELPDDGVAEAYEDSSFLLANGKAATTLNVQEILFGMMEKYPHGSKWGREEGECIAYAKMLQNALVKNGDMVAKYKDNSFESIRVGDRVDYHKSAGDGGHSVIVLKKYKDRIVTTSGNVGGEVDWGIIYFKYILDGFYSYKVATMWPDGLVQEEETETYKIPGKPSGRSSDEAKLWNGNPITSENVYAVIATRKSLYPEGWDTTIPGVEMTVSTATSFAQGIEWGLFNKSPYWEVSATWDNIKIADMVYVYADGEDHAVVVWDKGEDYVMVVDGYYNGGVRYERRISKDYLASGGFRVITYYP